MWIWYLPREWTSVMREPDNQWPNAKCPGSSANQNGANSSTTNSADDCWTIKYKKQRIIMMEINTQSTTENRQVESSHFTCALHLLHCKMHAQNAWKSCGNDKGWWFFFPAVCSVKCNRNTYENENLVHTQDMFTTKFTNDETRKNNKKMHLRTKEYISSSINPLAYFYIYERKSWMLEFYRNNVLIIITGQSIAESHWLLYFPSLRIILILWKRN